MAPSDTASANLDSACHEAVPHDIVDSDARLGASPNDAERRTNWLDRTPWPRSIFFLTLWLAPVLAAVWSTPWFVTQDGPAHLYNAHILLQSFRADSPFRGVFEVHWKPLPNWAGHVATAALLSILPPRSADRAITSIVLIATAGSILYLRIAFAGAREIAIASLHATLVALNMTWLLGFTSFLLGVCLYALILGFWNRRRDRPNVKNALILSFLWIACYFCHPIPLAGALLGVAVLEATTPGSNRRVRFGFSAASAVPLVPLLIAYRMIMKEGGGFEPKWGEMKGSIGPAAWIRQFGFVDPIALASKKFNPFEMLGIDIPGQIVAPSVWFVAAITILIVAAFVQGTWKDRRGISILGLALTLGGIVAPDTLGRSHGYFLSQRIVLLGLVAIVAAVDWRRRRIVARVAAIALAIAWVSQTAVVWNYARACDRDCGDLARARRALEPGDRVATLLVDINTPFRSNPLLHFDCSFGVGTGIVVWSDYETAYYYFPVRPIVGGNAPDPFLFERVAILKGRQNAGEREKLWSDLIDKHHNAFDKLVSWRRDEALDAISARRFDPEPIFTQGNTRVFQARRAKLDASDSRSIDRPR